MRARGLPETFSTRFIFIQKIKISFLAMGGGIINWIILVFSGEIYLHEEFGV
jgi:hypothetical protein